MKPSRPRNTLILFFGVENLITDLVAFDSKNQNQFAEK